MTEIETSAQRKQCFLDLRAVFIVAANSNLAPADHRQRDLILFDFQFGEIFENLPGGRKHKL